MACRWFRTLVVGLVALVSLWMIPEPASAQFRGPASFLNRLFGQDQEVAPPPGEIPNSPRRGVRNPNAPGQAAQPPRKKVPTAPSEPVYPVLDVMPKDADAKKILVVGDFMASGLAWGLDQAFADDTGVEIVDRADGSSGFARDDHYDWVATLPELLSEEKPDAVVVMIGSNDRQPIRTIDGKFAPRSDAWEKIYQQRVERFLLALQSYGKPVYWVGTPPLRSADSSADMVYLNTVFKSEAEAVGAHFIDIWDGFADENGTFVARGPDVDGQARQLRSGDGINFTKSGRRKLAFYAEREIRQQGGIGGAASTTALINPNETIEIGPDGKSRVVGAIVSLTDPAPGAADVPLAGAPSTDVVGSTRPLAGAPEGSAAYKLSVEGVAPEPKPGRADDFAWKPFGAASSKAEGDGTSVVDGIVILPAATGPANSVTTR